mgnify:CR=1 FL=1
MTVFAGILGMTGTMYISGVQLEEGKAANKLNLLLNSGFETLSESAPANWTFSADVQGTKYRPTVHTVVVLLWQDAETRHSAVSRRCMCRFRR